MSPSRVIGLASSRSTPRPAPAVRGAAPSCRPQRRVPAGSALPVGTRAPVGSTGSSSHCGGGAPRPDGVVPRGRRWPTRSGGSGCPPTDCSVGWGARRRTGACWGLPGTRPGRASDRAPASRPGARDERHHPSPVRTRQPLRARPPPTPLAVVGGRWCGRPPGRPAGPERVGLLHVLPGSPGSVVLGAHAQPVVFLAALAESTAVLGLLLPGAGVVALAGAGARAAGTPPPAAPGLVLLGAAGLLAGTAVNFQLGRLGLARLLRRPWTGASGPRLAAQLAAAAPLLRRHGWWVVLVASAFGATRSSLAVAAGAGGFPLRRLLAIQLPAALLWSGLYAGGGYALGDQWGRLEQAVRQTGRPGSRAAVLGAGAWWAARRWRRGRARVRVAVPAARGGAPVISDGAPIHRGQPVKAFLAAARRRLHLERLRLRPDLNPLDQGVWHLPEHVGLANGCRADLPHLRRELHGAAQRLRRKPHLVRAASVTLAPSGGSLRRDQWYGRRERARRGLGGGRRRRHGLVGRRQAALAGRPGAPVVRGGGRGGGHAGDRRPPLAGRAVAGARPGRRAGGGAAPLAARPHRPLGAGSAGWACWSASWRAPSGWGSRASRRCRSPPGRTRSAARSSAGRTRAGPRPSPPTPRSGARSSRRRGTRPTRRGASGCPTSRRRSACRSGCRCRW